MGYIEKIVYARNFDAYQIECFYNDMDVEVDEDNIEWQYFEKFEKKSVNIWNHIVRNEMDKELRFAGSIDMVYRDNRYIFMIGKGANK